MQMMRKNKSNCKLKKIELLSIQTKFGFEFRFKFEYYKKFISIFFESILNDFLILINFSFHNYLYFSYYINFSSLKKVVLVYTHKIS